MRATPGGGTKTRCKVVEDPQRKPSPPCCIRSGRCSGRLHTRRGALAHPVLFFGTPCGMLCHAASPSTLQELGPLLKFPSSPWRQALETQRWVKAVKDPAPADLCMQAARAHRRTPLALITSLLPRSALGRCSWFCKAAYACNTPDCNTCGATDGCNRPPPPPAPPPPALPPVMSSPSGQQPAATASNSSDAVPPSPQPPEPSPPPPPSPQPPEPSPPPLPPPVYYAHHHESGGVNLFVGMMPYHVPVEEPTLAVQMLVSMSSLTAMLFLSLVTWQMLARRRQTLAPRRCEAPTSAARVPCAHPPTRAWRRQGPIAEARPVLQAVGAIPGGRGRERDEEEHEPLVDAAAHPPAPVLPDGVELTAVVSGIRLEPPEHEEYAGPLHR